MDSVTFTNEVVVTSPIRHDDPSVPGLIQGTALMNFILPTIGVCTEEGLYFRLEGDGRFSYVTREISLGCGGTVDLGTYFNGLSIGKWRRHTMVDAIECNLEIQGVFDVRFVLRRLGRSEVVLAEHRISSDVQGLSKIEIPSWNEYEDGIICVRLVALDIGSFYGGCFSTRSAPARDVRLGIVVTTFNRQNYVIPAVHRLQENLLSRPDVGKLFSLVVIDNGMNLPLSSEGRMTVIPNANLGGAGGFTRGMLHLQDQGEATHCLLMDDDATCEVESIIRTLRVLQFARDEAMSVAGAMLLERNPSIQHERGAVFVAGTVRAVGEGLDLNDPDNILLNEREEGFDYAGWWFCAFPLNIVNNFAWPFFVRGDDILFSLDNLKTIFVLNGICSWQESFDDKQGPMCDYLSVRSNLTISFLKEDKGIKLRTIYAILRHIFLISCKYNYDRAGAVCQALEDVLKGPDFYAKNVSMLSKRTELANSNLEERADRFFDASLLAEYDHYPSVSIPKGMRYKIKALSSHLVPDWALKSVVDVRTCVQDDATYDVAFRRRSYVQYVSTPCVAYRLTRSRRRFVRTVWRGVKAGLALLGKQAALRRDYRARHAEMTSRSFWEKEFSKPIPQSVSSVANS